MRHVFGPRFLAESAFVVLVAVVVWYEGVSGAGIFGSIAAAWLLVALAEWIVGLRRRVRPAPVAEPEEPEPPRAPEPVVRAAPRAWNLWDLERRASETVGPDTAGDEERSFLLMHLREFAAADGALPVEFDPLVRETFGDLLETARP